MKFWKFLFFLCVCLNGYGENITVVGIGKLGLCTALSLEKAGYHVLGCDISQDYIDKLNAKTFSSLEPQVNEYLRASKNFRATTSLKEAMDFSNLCLIVVPTPTAPSPESYDHSILNQLLKNIDALQVSNKHIVVCCTVLPGYNKNVGLSLLSHCKNVTLSYNPEFIAQGEIMKGFQNPDMVLIGEGSKEAGDLLESMHKKVCTCTPFIARMSPESAEIAKLAVNCFITAKIAFANLVADIADNTPGANKVDILNAVGKDKRIGNRCLMPGYGFGGPCFPRDNRALSSYASTVGIEPLIFNATDQANDAHALFMAQQFQKMGLTEYLFEDVCYKPNCPVPIIEESQKLRVAKILSDLGNKVTIADRDVVISQIKEQYGNLFKYQSK